MRTIPLFPQLRAALSGHHGRVIPELYHSDNYFNISNNIRRRWKSDMTNFTSKPWEVTPYDLRHSFCCWCRDAGIEIHTVASWMGHCDATMITKIYDHVSTDRNRTETQKMMDAALKQMIVVDSPASSQTGVNF